MSNLMSFWKWFESRPSRTAVMTQWRNMAGDGLPVIKAMLQPLDRLATAYPNPRRYGLPMKVVRHSDDLVVAIDEQDWQHRFSLTPQKAVLHQLDLRKLRTILCDTLDGVNIAKTFVDQATDCLQIGNWEPKKAASFPIYLLMCRHRGVLQEQVLHLLAKHECPGAILLTPSRMNWDSDVEDLARSGKMLLVPLAEVIEPDGSTFRETDEWEEYLQGFAQMVKMTLPSNYRNKKPIPMRGTRATNIERLEKELERYLISARDHARSFRDRGLTPKLLPRPTQKKLAKSLDITTAAVSRCLTDPRATVLKVLWEIINSPEEVMKYKTIRRR